MYYSVFLYFCNFEQIYPIIKGMFLTSFNFLPWSQIFEIQLETILLKNQ